MVSGDFEVVPVEGEDFRGAESGEEPKDHVGQQAGGVAFCVGGTEQADSGVEVDQARCLFSSGRWVRDVIEGIGCEPAREGRGLGGGSSSEMARVLGKLKETVQDYGVVLGRLAGNARAVDEGGYLLGSDVFDVGCSANGAGELLGPAFEVLHGARTQTGLPAIVEESFPEAFEGDVSGRWPMVAKVEVHGGFEGEGSAIAFGQSR